MPHKRRLLKRNHQSIKLRGVILNLGMGILCLFILGFIFSGIDRMFFNHGMDIEKPNMEILFTKTSYEKETGHKIQVEILNGCGIPKLARMYTEYLRSEGFDVIDSKNADNFEYVTTKILHHRGGIERAYDLADIMMFDKNRIIENKNENLFIDLTLILGEDYKDLPSYRYALMYQQPF